MTRASLPRGIAGCAVVLASVVPSAVIATGCSSTVTDAAGLMLVVTTDGTLPQADKLHIKITSADGAQTYRDQDYRIPADTTLPTTLGIATTGSDTTTVKVNVSLYAGSTLLDDRENQITEIPNDRIAELDIVLSAACSAHVMTSAAGPLSNCPNSGTCNPATGGCQSESISGSTLGTFGADGGSRALPPRDAAASDAGDGSLADGPLDGSVDTIRDASSDAARAFDAADATVTTPTYTIGGTVTGLGAGTLVLHEATGGDDLTVTGNGAFTFHTALASNQMYTVTVATEPSMPSQTCVVTPGTDTGTVASGNVTSVTIQCTTNVYTVGGTATGIYANDLIYVSLAGTTGMYPVSQNNTPFAFSPLASGASYSVTVFSGAFGNIPQTCVVTNGDGVVTDHDIDDVLVTCTTDSYPIGGTVFGLQTGESVVLQDNAGNDLTVTANGTFKFTNDITYNSPYAVTVRTSPAGHTCAVSANAKGTATAAVTNVVVTCPPATYASLGQGTDSTHECALAADHSVWCWGQGNEDALGDGDTTGANKLAAVPAGTSTAWSQLATGFYHSCAIRSDHTLWCWGSEQYGALGNGVTTGGLGVPTQIGTDTTWSSVAIANDGGCGIRLDGSLACWGYDAYIDPVTMTGSTSTPQTIGTSTAWTSVAVGLVRVCGLQSGTLFCWGGYTGDGTNTTRNVPTQIGSATTWTSLTLGAYNTCAIQSADHSLWCWGPNGNGELGDGTTTQSLSPEHIAVGSTWSQVSTSGNMTCAIKTDGTLWCWGRNMEGELGDGTTTQRLLPTQVGTSPAWTSVSAGQETVCAMQSGTVYCWGNGANGQLGNGTTLNSSTPVVAY